MVGVFNNGNFVGNAALNQLYIDGVKQTLTQKQGSQVNPKTASASTALGAYLYSGGISTTYAFGGSIGNVMIYNKKLTQSEVSDIYSIQKPGYP